MDLMSNADCDVIARFEAAGQGHVFRFLGDLDLAARSALLEQAAGIDLEEVARLAAHTDGPAGGEVLPPGDELIALPADDAGLRATTEARARGEEELRAGRVAVVVAAGGQGTRLGSPAAKALWPAGPTSGKPLLQWLADKVRYWCGRSGAPIPFVVMVSDATVREVEGLLRWHGFFGLDPTWVRTAVQGSLPPLDADGKLLLATRSGIATAPNGHGGVYRALRDARLLDLFADHGITTLSYVQVDNPLIQAVDPVFVGHHVERGSQISSKGVAKHDPAERVGVFARVDGRPAVVEYSELSDEQAASRDAGGDLVFGHGSIAAHCLDVGFAQSMAEHGLPVHCAHKKVPHVGRDGALVRPSAPNATKFESFLFDAIPLAEHSLVLETTRAREFSPIKNAAGRDTPDTARRDLVALFRGWHERAGVPCTEGLLEVDPAAAPDERAFRALHGLPVEP